MKKTLILAGLLLVGYANAQAQVDQNEGKVSINTTEPKATFQVNPFKTDGSTLEGVLVPRLAKASLVEMKKITELQEATLVYVTDEVATADNADFVGTGKGFYYYNGTDKKWTKLGAGASAGTTEATKTLRSVTAITAKEWEGGQYALSTTTTSPIVLPSAAEKSNENRIIAVHNDTGTTVNYASPAPVRNSTIAPGKGQILMASNGKWYVIGGL